MTREGQKRESVLIVRMSGPAGNRQAGRARDDCGRWIAGVPKPMTSGAKADGRFANRTLSICPRRMSTAALRAKTDPSFCK
jgi:hypothetical protein